MQQNTTTTKKTKDKKRAKLVTLQITTPLTNGKRKTKTNGHGRNGIVERGTFLGKNSRNFETRFIPRYESIPQPPADLEIPTFSEASQRILKERYLLKGGNLEAVETIAERFWHLSYDIASADFDFGSTKEAVFKAAKQFYKTMVRQEFLPNSPTIMNAGKQNQLQYSACFVLPVEDSLPEIFDAMKYAALIHQTGGGTGFAFSRLRPAGSVVKRSGGVASGPVSFLRVFDAATQAIKQGGTRRGANMGILRIDHPDVMEFIRCKAELDEQNQPIYEGIAPLLPDDNARDYFKTLLLDRQISNFNISAAITDRFMDAYYKGKDYDLIDPRTNEVTDRLNAKEVFEEIVERAWRTGDPGCIFIDRINNSPANPVPDLETIESTNPCGEQPLGPFDACNLGSINLGKFVLEDGSDVDWEGLKRVTREAVHFLDNVVQVNPYTLPQIFEEVHKNRRIGLGVMGWADMLFKLKIPYDSEGAIALGEKVMKFVNDEAVRMSEDLAEVRGPFPNWQYSRYKNSKPRRNGTVTTIAPTGTISIIGDCSSGIEPVFALAYIHRAKGDGGKTGNEMRYLTIANKTFTDIGKELGFWNEELAQKVMDHGAVSGVDDVPQDWQRVFVTAPEIAPEWHVKMQAAFQKHTENGVSKTINLPNSATRDDVRQAYLLAWETGCNGITVYRDGSKTTQVLNVASTLSNKSQETESVVSVVDPREARPMILRGRTYKIMTPVGKAYVTINRNDKDEPFEVFLTVGKGGMHTMADAEAIGRLASISLRVSGSNRLEIAKEIIDQLSGIGGSSHVGFGKDRVMSLADALAKVLAEDMALAQASNQEAEQVPLSLTNGSADKNQADDVASTPLLNMGVNTQADLCPECGEATFVREDGCQKCYSCGYSKC
ncbi:adenosylcobalamin-dependent ribonucleoside-diphosphate reductase [Candidatus Daviesbacteria bacterium]|nr:adenosylcobalamin-dependent ribonucleoside-diphosphate reductase [Candidatus Daviesbacteria bacterium]